MTPAQPAAERRALRAQRKQDLLLASALARGQAVQAFDEIAQRTEGVASWLLALRARAADPAVWAAGSAAGALVLGLLLRRGLRGRGRRPLRLLRVLRWAWLAHRVWRGLRGRRWRRAAPS